MRSYPLSILVFCLLLSVAAPADAADKVVSPVGERLPNVKASIDDGFFALAEQQARGVLRADPDDETRHEAVLLLAHALWGQKRYTEMLDMLEGRGDRAGYVYWRTRARYELRQYGAALMEMEGADPGMKGSAYAPAGLRLQGHVEQRLGWLDVAEATYRRFLKLYPDHGERVANLFDLAEVLVLQAKVPEALAVYGMLAEEKNARASQRARLKQAHLLYTESAVEDFETARSLFSELATNDHNRLAFRIDAFVDLAALEEKADDQTAAAAALQEAIALSPDARQRVPVKLALARLLLRNGDASTALKLLEECRAEVPNETLAAQLQLEKAAALLQAGRYKEADEAYQIYLDVAADEEGLARAYFGKGLALWELGRYAECATAMDKAVNGLEKPDDIADALFKAGDAYYAAGNFADAEKRYRTFSVDFPRHPNLPNALYQHGLSLAKTDRRTEALAAFQTLETEHPSSPFAEMAALRAADVMRAGGQWEAALDKYTEIGKTYTNRAASAVSLHQRGLVLFQLQRYTEALEAFEQVMDDYPESEHVPQATFMRGFCLYWQGQLAEAVEACRNFIEQYPDSEWAPKVIFWLAEQYYNQGDYVQAEPLFMQIADTFKQNPLAPRALYWGGRSVAAQANYVTAIERYSAVAKEYPGSDVLPQTRFAQGDALSELGQFARAILAFDEIIKNYPESHLVSPAWGRKGDCQFSLAAEDPVRYAEAMNSYQAILDRPSASFSLKLQAEYKLGRCLEKTEVFDQAFNRYMNAVYTFINENVERSPDSVLWFTRAASGAAALKEREKDWEKAVQVYERVIEAGVPAGEEAQKRISRIKADNWLLFEQAGTVE